MIEVTANLVKKARGRLCKKNSIMKIEQSIKEINIMISHQ